MNQEETAKQLQRTQVFLAKLKDMKSEQYMELVESTISNDSIECFCDHIEEFYGIQDDEQIGVLAQIFITGFIAGVNENSTK